MKRLQAPRSVSRNLLMAMIAVSSLALAACGGSASSKKATSSPSASSSATAPSNVQAITSCSATGTAVSSSSQLQHALDNATPGAEIVMASGKYSGHFTIKHSGTAQAPITICGGRNSVIDSGSVKSGYGFYVNHASYLQLKGFTVQNAQKGVVTDGMNHSLIQGLYVHDTGDEAVHLREFSSDNTVQSVTISDTGHNSSFFGEGLYVGTANKNWCKYTSCNPDKSDRNTLVQNDISNTTAENIDIKEGTTGGVIEQNHLDGTGMDPKSATAWINGKGNDWTVKDNVGQNSPKDGFQVHRVYTGWGENNIFEGNSGNANGSGYGIYVQSHSLGTQVSCDNTVTSQGGLSNQSCG